MVKVAITDLEYDKAPDVFMNAADFACLKAPTPEPELAEFIIDYNISHVIVGVEQYRDELYSALPRGGVIARFGVGHDGIDKTLASQKGLYCTNTPGALDDSVAECAIGLILTAARHLASCTADNKSNIWKNRVGVELAGKTLAIIGCGNIGLKTAGIARHGFNMNIVGFDVRQPGNLNNIDLFKLDFAEAVLNADFVSLHIPDIPATKDFINMERLEMMKKTAYLINTARGNVVDEVALYDAVQSGAISGAALDVLKNEPYLPQNIDKDLRSLENVIMTPHIGSSTIEACTNMAEKALQCIRCIGNGNFDFPGLLNNK